MTTTQTQAIIRKSYTVTLTFTGVPDAQLRKRLMAEGFAFRNGQWVKNQAQSSVIDEENVAASIAA